MAVTFTYASTVPKSRFIDHGSWHPPISVGIIESNTNLHPYACETEGHWKAPATVPLSTSPPLGGDVRAMLRDGGDHPRVGLPRVGVDKRELVAVHQQRQDHLKQHAGRLFIPGGLKESG